jgi:hypothetical protein
MKLRLAQTAEVTVVLKRSLFKRGDPGGRDQRRATIVSSPYKLRGDRTTGGLTPGATIDTRIEGFHR